MLKKNDVVFVELTQLLHVQVLEETSSAINLLVVNSCWKKDEEKKKKRNYHFHSCSEKTNSDSNIGLKRF